MNWLDQVKWDDKGLVPVIASGGVGNLDHLADGVQQGGADAVLAASIFHYGEYTVQQAGDIAFFGVTAVGHFTGFDDGRQAGQRIG